MKYYLSSRNILLIPDDKRTVSIPFQDPSYNLARLLIINKNLEDLRFFTEYGYRIQLDNVIFESTQSPSLNIYFNNEIYSSTSELYPKIISLIISFYNKEPVNPSSIITSIKDYFVSIKHYLNIPNTKISHKSIIINGSYGTYTIDTENNNVYLSNKHGKNQFVCIHANTHDYMPPDMNEKEASILTKMLFCLNDSKFFPSDPILKKFSNQIQE